MGEILMRTSRRESKKAQKWQQILSAALDLFEEKPYDEITTQELAERAGIPIGTFFRYVNSKQDLLIRVFFNQLVAGMEASQKRLDAGQSALECIVALIEPFAHLKRSYLENATAFEQAVQFGSPDSKIRVDALDQVQTFRSQIRTILAKTRYCEDTYGNEEYLDMAAHVIYATMYMDVVQVGVGRIQAENLLSTVREHTEFLLDHLAR